MHTKAWSSVAVSVIALATVEGSKAKRPNGMPRRRWQRVASGRRWSRAVEREVRYLAYLQRIAAERAERQRLGIGWWK